MDEQRVPPPADEAAPAPAPDEGASPGPARDSGDAWTRLRRALSLRHSPGTTIAVGVLLALLGFAVVATVRGNTTDAFLRNARQTDLVRALDDLGQRQARLDAELRALQAQKDRIESGTEAQALVATTDRANAYAILAGTIAATGPGVEITIGDPGGGVDAPTVLDAIEELRDAGAEAIQVGNVRVVASTWFADADRGISVGGKVLVPPYSIRAIGDSQTMATAMEIPGGVVDTVRAAGGTIVVTRKDKVDVTALQPLSTPQYAQPAPSPAG